jgi:putative transcriptional regulator
VETKKKNMDSLKGHFIMAMPGLADPNFSMTVTCICEHTELGSVGLIINRRHNTICANDIFKELNLEYILRPDPLPAYIGGPVHENEIFVLHGPPFDWEGCFMVDKTLAMSNTMDILNSIAVGKGPNSFLVCLGCAGWGPGQLESEIRQNSWITCPVSSDIIFDLPAEAKWRAAMNRVGIDPALLSSRVGHA